MTHLSPAPATALSVEEAREIILRGVTPLGRERVMLDDALGRTLAEDIASPINWPRFDLSAMDGYALCGQDLPAAGQTCLLPVREHISAGARPTRSVVPGEASRIMTGAPMPQGADTVVKREDTNETDDQVEILLAPASGRGANVRTCGEDFRVGDKLLPAGTMVDPGVCGLLASFERAQVSVWRRPRVAIVTTGDELVEVDGGPVPFGKIVNSSSYMVAAQVRAAGGLPWVLPAARDSHAEITAAFNSAIAGADAVFCTGGVSMGDFDLVRQVIEELSDDLILWRVKMKPGKPLAFGRIGGIPLLGLPGNPVSSYVGFMQFGWPLLRRLAGRSDILLPRIPARSTRALRGPKGRVEFIRGWLRPTISGWDFEPVSGQSSGNLLSVSAIDGLGVLQEGAVIEQGGTIVVELVGPLPGIVA